MKNRSVSSGPIVLIIALLLTVVCGFVTWRLFPVPFGTLFETFLALTLAGLVLCLAALAVMAMRAKRAWLKAVGIVPAAGAIALAVAGIVLKVDYRLLPGTCYGYGMSAEEWRDDVRYFAGQFPEKHIRLFEMVDREQFESAAAALEQSVPSLDENGIRNGIFRLAAMAGDAHSYPNIFTHKLDWHSLPLKLWLFDDGVYVLDAGREHGEMVGARILEIGGVPVTEAYERLRPYLSHESESGWKERFLYCLGVAEFLKAEGIIGDTGRVGMTYETREGIRVTREIGTHHYVPVIYWSSLRPVDNGVPYVIPNDRRDNWRFEYLEDTGTLYLQFNACQRVNGEDRIEDFVQRLGNWIEENDFERLVCDIRSNGGGDAYVSQQIAGLMIGNARVDRPGRLFVLTSRRTFSAAVMFLSLVENQTGAVIVGEPTGQGPFFCGGPQPVTLPNSGLQILAATHYNRCSLFDDGRESIEPDVPVEYAADDFFAGRDPMMDAVMAYEPPKRAPAPDAGERERLTGRYAFSPYQVLTVEEEGEGLLLRIDDFFDGSYRNVRTGLYRAGGDGFDTDIDGVSIVFHGEEGNAAEGVTVRWRGIETYAGRAEEGALLPMEMFAEGRTGEAVEILYGQRDIYRSGIPDLEARLNGMGYALLREEKDAQAIDVLELNTKLFPESANTYDSLGEAYMLSGDRERAMRLYERALELNPESANAREILDRLRKGQTWDRENRRWTG